LFKRFKKSNRKVCERKNSLEKIKKRRRKRMATVTKSQLIEAVHQQGVLGGKLSFKRCGQIETPGIEEKYFTYVAEFQGNKISVIPRYDQASKEVEFTVRIKDADGVLLVDLTADYSTMYADIIGEQASAEAKAIDQLHAELTKK